MSERWEREVKRLRGEEMPPVIRERVERGPQRELPHDGRQRVVAGLVAFAVFAAAGAFAWRTFDRAGTAGTEPTPSPAPGPAVVTLMESNSEYPHVPGAEMTYGADRAPGQLASFSWGNAIVDTITPQFRRPLLVPSGTIVAVRGDAESVRAGLVEGRGFKLSRPIALRSGELILPQAPGSYFLEVTGTWTKGTVSFYFAIEVLDPGALVLTLTSRPANPVATLSSGGLSQDGARGSYDWCTGASPSGLDGASGVASDAGIDGSDTCSAEEIFGVPPAPGYLSVPGSTSIVPAGDGLLTHLMIRTTAPDGDIGKIVAEADGTDARTPDAPGRYVVVVSASWGDRGGAEFFFGVEVAPPAGEIPDILHLECTSQTASVDASIVRARSDGVHIVVDASDEVRGVDIVSGPEAREFSGVGFPVDGHGSRGTPIEPGRWHVGCYSAGGGIGSSDVGTERAASFTVVDPDGFYAPVDLACEELTTRLFPVTGTPSAGNPEVYEPSPVTVEESAAAVPGILPTDVVRVAGYADGPGFKLGPLYSVLRDGRTVARLHVPVEVGSTWGVSVDACPGSGIGPDAPPGAAGPTPDTAVVRCLESRTEVATPIVNTQSDGLHIEVQNAGGSQALVVVGGWERDRIFTIPIADQVASIVVPVRPGHVQISCRSNAETENAAPYEDRLSDGLQLQDRSGFFLPYAPTCDSSEEIPLVTPKFWLLPATEASVRDHLSGVLNSDTVERAGYLVSRGDDVTWRIVRDGEVVAQVEFPSLEGITCRGAGITGRR